MEKNDSDMIYTIKNSYVELINAKSTKLIQKTKEIQ